MNRRYLIVDDNLPLAENLAEILTDAGARVTVTDLPRTALDLVSTERFDALITDFRMPDMSGLELVRRCRSVVPALAVVVMSAYSRETVLNDASRFGPDATPEVLLKPFDVRELIALLDRLVAARPGT